MDSNHERYVPILVPEQELTTLLYALLDQYKSTDRGHKGILHLMILVHKAMLEHFREELAQFEREVAELEAEAKDLI